MLLGSINHVSIVVTDLPAAMTFFRPLLEFLGCTVGSIEYHPPAETSLVVNLNERNGVAFKTIRSTSTSPGSTTSRSTSRSTTRSTRWPRSCRRSAARCSKGRESIRSVPGGYYAVYFLGPDRVKFEVVHMPLAEQRCRERGVL